MNIKRVGTLGMLVLLTVILTGCGMQQRQQNAQSRKSMTILNTHAYDVKHPGGKKTESVREIAKELQLQQVGLSGKAVTYPKVGIASGQGVFIQAAITDGDGIPILPSLSASEQSKLNSAGDKYGNNYYKHAQVSSYSKVVAKRKSDLAQNNQVLGNEQQQLESSIQSEINAQSQKTSTAKRKTLTNSKTKDSIAVDDKAGVNTAGKK